MNFFRTAPRGGEAARDPVLETKPSSVLDALMSTPLEDAVAAELLPPLSEYEAQGAWVGAHDETGAPAARSTAGGPAAAPELTPLERSYAAVPPEGPTVRKLERRKARRGRSMPPPRSGDEFGGAGGGDAPLGARPFLPPDAAADDDDEWAGYDAPGGADDEPSLLYPGRPAALARPAGFFGRVGGGGGDASRRPSGGAALLPAVSMLRVFDDGTGVETRWSVAPPSQALTATTNTCEVTATLRAVTEASASGGARSPADDGAGAELPAKELPAKELPTTEIVVTFLDGSLLTVTARVDDSARSVMSAAALRLGVGAEYVSSLSLYAFRDGGCERRIDPATPAGAVRAFETVVLAVRLVTGPQRASALRGFSVDTASTSEYALARLLYAQAAGAVMAGFPLREPELATRLAALRLWSRARDLAAVKDMPEATAEFARPLAITLLATHGPATFGPAAFLGEPAAASNAVLRELDLLLAADAERRSEADRRPPAPPRSPEEQADLERQGIEIEIVESVEDVPYFNDGARPESDYLALVSSLPLYGAALFPCAVRRRAAGEPHEDEAVRVRVANRVLAISRRGAAILDAALTTELQVISMDRLRRWRAHRDAILFESEKPFDHWSPAFLRRRSKVDDADKRKRLRRLAATARGKVRGRNSIGGAPSAEAAPKKKATGWGSWATALLGGGQGAPAPAPLPPPPASLSEEESEASEDSDLEAPMQRVRFELDLVEAEGCAGARAREIVDLLDDYSVYDLVEDRPRCQYHSIFGTGLPMNGTSRVAKATVGTSAQMATEGGGALGEQPTVYNALVSAVVRPPRFLYDARLLGPSSFEFGGKRFFRHDLVIRNQRGLRLHCSHWRPAEPAKGPRPVVVFMHANSASRIQACSYLPVALSLGCTMFAFDCCGSGVSDGTYVSLGWHEADDLLVALTHLRKRRDTGQIVVWGHSMGAASVIYYQGRYRGASPRIDAAVLDSPYADFEELANHLVKQNSAVATGSLGKYVVGFSLTRMALNLVLESIDASCRQLAHFSPLKDLSPISHAAACVTPALFMQARSDRIIALAHVEGLANRYGGTRKLAIVDGTHSSPRNGAARHFIAQYLKKNLKLPPESSRPDTRNRDRYLELSPWHRPRSALPPAA